MDKGIEELSDKNFDFLERKALLDYLKNLTSKLDDLLEIKTIKIISKNFVNFTIPSYEIKEVSKDVKSNLEQIALNTPNNWFRAYINELLFTIEKKHSQYWSKALSGYLDSFLSIRSIDPKKFILLLKASNLQRFFRDNRIFNQKKERLLDLFTNLSSENADRFIRYFGVFLKYLDQLELEKVDSKINSVVNELKKDEKYSKLEYLLLSAEKTLKYRLDKEEYRLWVRKELLSCLENIGDRREPLVGRAFYRDAFKVASKLGDQTAMARIKQKLSKPIDDSEFPEISIDGSDSVKAVIHHLNEWETGLDPNMPDKMKPIFTLGSMVYRLFTSKIIEKVLDGQLSQGVGVARQIFPLSIIKSDGSEQSLVQGTDEYKRYHIKRYALLNYDIILHGSYYYLREKQMTDFKAIFDALLIMSKGFSESTRVFLYQGLREHFSENWINSIHLFAPLLERMIFEVIKENGCDDKSVFQSGSQVTIWRKTLNILEDDERVLETLSEGFNLVLSGVLKDPNFNNIRNRVAHGLITPDECGEVNSFSLLLLIMMLCYRKGHLQADKEKHSELP